MSVKSIFKILIGTIVVIVLSSVIIELFNINITGVMISQYVQLAADQSCTLYTQETYRKGTSSGAASEVEIFYSDGSSYSGAPGAGDFHNFYGGVGLTSEDIWRNIYGVNNADFKDEMQDLYNEVSVVLGTNYNGTVEFMFPELASLRYMAYASGNLYTDDEITFDGDLWNVSETDINYVNYLNYNRANTYMKNMYTPVNIGIPYIDKHVASKMFKWNLTQLLSNCSSGNITKDANGSYVNFNGFAVYTQEAEIIDFNYHVCDLNTTDGKELLKRLTSIDANSLVLKDLGTIDTYTKVSNNIVVVVEVDYSVPVSYKGITPLKSIFDYFMNRDTTLVTGYDGQHSTRTALEYTIDNSKDINSKNSLNYDVYTDEYSGNGRLSIGKLYYTLVR